MDFYIVFMVAFTAGVLGIVIGYEACRRNYQPYLYWNRTTGYSGAFHAIIGGSRWVTSDWGATWTQIA